MRGMLTNKETLRSNLSELTENVALLISENEKLEEQIKKMKNCYNCKHGFTRYKGCNACSKQRYDSWELKK